MTTRPPRDGWHWAEWAAELAGTAVLMFAVVSAKYLAVRAGAPYGDLWARIIIVGAVAGAVVVAVAASPLGRRSGAHLNPAVTFGLWLQRAVGDGDLIGYTLAQTAGGICGFAAGAMWGAGVGRAPVSWAVIAPSVNELASALIEAAATAAQLGLVFWLGAMGSARCRGPAHLRGDRPRHNQRCRVQPGAWTRPRRHRGKVPGHLDLCGRPTGRGRSRRRRVPPRARPTTRHRQAAPRPREALLSQLRSAPPRRPLDEPRQRPRPRGDAVTRVTAPTLDEISALRRRRDAVAAAA